MRSPGRGGRTGAVPGPDPRFARFGRPMDNGFVAFARTGAGPRGIARRLRMVDDVGC